VITPTKREQSAAHRRRASHRGPHLRADNASPAEELSALKRSHAGKQRPSYCMTALSIAAGASAAGSTAAFSLPEVSTPNRRSENPLRIAFDRQFSSNSAPTNRKVLPLSATAFVDTVLTRQT
jgi:hypothetical protein